MDHGNSYPQCDSCVSNTLRKAQIIKVKKCILSPRIIVPDSMGRPLATINSTGCEYSAARLTGSIY